MAYARPQHAKADEAARMPADGGMRPQQIRYVPNCPRIAATTLGIAAILSLLLLPRILSTGTQAAGEGSARLPVIGGTALVPTVPEGDASFAALPASNPESGSPLRIAHQKNSHEKFEAAAGFDGIEVDVRGEVDEGGDHMLLHDAYHGYTLRQFLCDCRRSGQLAVLDLKYEADPSKVAQVVADEGMMGRAIFQVAYGDWAGEICGEFPAARCWLLNGAGDEAGLRDDVAKYARYLEGVNVCGQVASAEKAGGIVGEIKSMAGRGGNPLRTCVFAYGQRTDVYGNDALYPKGAQSAPASEPCR